MNGRRTGRACIFDTRCTLESQIWRSLQHQRGGKILRRKSRVEMSKHDLVDVLGRDSSVRQRAIGGINDQAFDGFAFQATELAVRPSDDAGCHALFSLAEFWSLSFGIYHRPKYKYNTCVVTGMVGLSLAARPWSR